MRVRTSGQLVSPLGNSVSPIDTAAEQAHTPRRASAELQTLAEPGTVDHEDSPTSSPHGLFVRFGSGLQAGPGDRKSTRLNSSHSQISYAVFCLKKKTQRLAYVSRSTDPH